MISEQALRTLAETCERVWTIPPKLCCSDWADRYQRLDELTSAEPGQYRVSRTPYIREILDAFTDDAVDTITFVKSTQVGGTQVLMNCLAYAVHQDPEPTLFVMPTKDVLKKFASERLEPQFRNNPIFSDRLKRNALKREVFQFHGMNLSFGWAGSPSTLASTPIRYLFMDEIDKWPRFSGKEANPRNLALERTRTYLSRRKVVQTSTPTIETGEIWRQWLASDQRRFHIPCPHCGEFQPLRFSKETVVWPEESTVETIDHGRTARYVCCHCGAMIEDKDKPRMLASGVWCPDGCKVGKSGRIDGEIKSGRHRGYHLNALYSPWLTWSDIACEFLRSKDSIDTLMNFRNSWEGLPWVEEVDNVTEETVMRKMMDYSKGVAPEGVKILTAGVDVQRDYGYVVIRGWGSNEESWLIVACEVPLPINQPWVALKQLLFESDFGLTGTDWPYVRMAAIDSGYRTGEVYNFTRQFPEVTRAIKGHQVLHGAPQYTSTVQKNPVTGRAEGFGHRVTHIDINFYTDKLARLINSKPGDLSEWHLCHPVDPKYLKQMTAKHKVMKVNHSTGARSYVWEHVTDGRDDHYFDCEVYATAAADIIALPRALTVENPEMVIVPPKPAPPRRKRAPAKGFLSGIRRKR